MIAGGLRFGLAGVLILAGLGCHRSLGHGAQDAAGGGGSGAQPDAGASGDAAGDGQAAGSGGRLDAAGGSGGGGAGTGGLGAAAGGAGGAAGSGAGGVGGLGAGGSGGPAIDAGPDGATDASAGVTYAGCSFIGGYDHVSIVKGDAERGVCVRLDLVYPMVQMPKTLGLTLPQNWGVQTAARWDMDPSGGCNKIGADYQIADSGAGLVVLHGAAPAQIADADLTLSFPAGGALPARTESMVVHGLDVRGSGC